MVAPWLRRASDKVKKAFNKSNKNIARKFDKLEKALQPAVKQIGDAVKWGAGEAKELIEGTVHAITKAEGNIASGTDFLKYAPWVGAGIIGLLIFRAESVGRGVRDVGSGVRNFI